jgi:hypothetical protein
MSTKYYGDKGILELKEKLNSIIEIENEDNLRTHFKNGILKINNTKVSGEIINNTFKIWITDKLGVFYPVVLGNFKSINNGIEIELSSKMNIIGKALCAGIMTILAYAIIFGIIIQENNEIRFLILRSIVGLIIYGLMLSLPIIIYKRTSKALINYLIEELKIRNAR